MNDLDEAVRDHAQYMGNCCGRASEAANELAVLNKALGQALACNDDLAKMNARLGGENRELTDSLYAEAKRSLKALELISRVSYAIGTDTIDRLDYKPYLEWVENFPKPPIISATSPK